MGKILEFKNHRDFIKAYKKVPWRYSIYRDESILLVSMIWRGFATTKNYKKLFGLNYSWKNEKVIKFHIFLDERDIESIIRVGSRFSMPRLMNIIKKCYYYGEELMAFSKKTKESDYKKFTTAELLKIFSGYKERLTRFSAFVIFPMWSFDRPTGEKIAEFLKKKNVKNAENSLRVLTFPRKKNTIFFEQVNFLNIVRRINKNFKLKKMFSNNSSKIIITNIKGSDIFNKINNHIEKFGWLQCRNFYGREWTIKEMIERIKTVMPTAQDQLSKLLRLEKKMRVEYQKIIRLLKIKKDFLSLVEAAKELAYYRTYRTDVIHESGFNTRRLLREIGGRFGYNFNDLILMTAEEIQNLPKYKINKKILKERKKGFANILVGGKVNIFWGKDLRRYEEELRDFKKSQSKETEIKGNVAFAGKIKGEAKIIKKVSDLPKIKNGDILVAPMTFPSFIPAMEKAAAFVTNEGGILCHAAIVSREMRKPCLIGTKNATEIIKDGDYVEVDANKGVVKILK